MLCDYFIMSGYKNQGQYVPESMLITWNHYLYIILSQWVTWFLCTMHSMDRWVILFYKCTRLEGIILQSFHISNIYIFTPNKYIKIHINLMKYYTWKRNETIACRAVVYFWIMVNRSHDKTHRCSALLTI